MGGDWLDIRAGLRKKKLTTGSGGGARPHISDVHERLTPIQPTTPARIAALSILVGVTTACGIRDGVTGGEAVGRAAAAEAAYRAPPSLTDARKLASGTWLLGGAANPKAQVRLTTPAGVQRPARVDGVGRWQVVLPPVPAGVRLFGLAAVEGARTVQAEGYLAVTAGGEIAQLRAGSGAWVLGQIAGPGAAVRILALDFDRKGGAVVSGIGPAGAAITVRVDGLRRGQVTADAAGRFALALDEPLAPGEHRLEAAKGDLVSQALLTMSPARSLVGEAFRAVRSASGWRIDWMTPGGGVQTTLLMDSAEAAA